MPVLSAGDLGVVIDFASSDESAILEIEIQGEWQTYTQNGGKVTVGDMDIEKLPPGRYRAGHTAPPTGS